MDEATKSEVAAILKALRESAGKVEGFVLEQAPGVIREMVVYGRAFYSVGLLFWAAVLVAVAIAVRSAFVRRWHEELDDAFQVLLFICGLSGAASGIVGFLICGHGVLLTWFAPRIYVLQQIAGYLK